MFEFLLSIRVSFFVEGVGRMPSRCAATLSYYNGARGFRLNLASHVGYVTKKNEFEVGEN